MLYMCIYIYLLFSFLSVLIILVSCFCGKVFSTLWIVQFQFYSANLRNSSLVRYTTWWKFIRKSHYAISYPRHVLIVIEKKKKLKRKTSCNDDDELFINVTLIIYKITLSKLFSRSFNIEEKNKKIKKGNYIIEFFFFFFSMQLIWSRFYNSILF